jgi:hypothetical protein
MLLIVDGGQLYHFDMKVYFSKAIPLAGREGL